MTVTIPYLRTTGKPSALTVLLAASASAALWSGAAYGDHYDRIVQFDCDPGRNVVHISLRMAYQDTKLGSHDVLFDTLAEKPAGLSCRLPHGNTVVVRALSNPQATRNDNLQILVNASAVASLSFEPLSNDSATISETSQGTVRVDQTKQNQ